MLLKKFESPASLSLSLFCKWNSIFVDDSRRAISTSLCLSQGSNFGRHAIFQKLPSFIIFCSTMGFKSCHSSFFLTFGNSINNVKNAKWSIKSHPMRIYLKNARMLIFWDCKLISKYVWWFQRLLTLEKILAMIVFFSSSFVYKESSKAKRECQGWK